MEQHDGRRKALAPLTGLKPDEETFALHLRAIRDQLGMTSAEIAERLNGIEATRLSKCLGGKSLPQPSILTELHRLLEEKAGIPFSSQAAADSRALLYAAARSRGPLTAREYELAEAREALETQRVETAEELTRLRRDLRDEQHRRFAVERALSRLREADTRAQDGERQLRELTEQLDAAQQRIGELEEEVLQTQALLQLQQSDDAHLADMIDETRVAIEQCQTDAAGSGMADAAATSVALLAPAEVVQKVRELRHADQDDDADELLRLIATLRNDTDIAELRRSFRSENRKKDLDRFELLVVANADALKILSVARLGFGGFGVSDYLFLQLAGLHAPLPVAIRMLKFLDEDGRTSEHRDVASAAAQRSVDDVIALWETGMLDAGDARGGLAKTTMEKRTTAEQAILIAERKRLELSPYYFSEDVGLVAMWRGMRRRR
ncbi:hypothetical protein ACFVEN_44425 [Streptomyces sp. NPDC057681]|uniref:hypothetical protein n=1 Tax=Streptomyces sp. NPDC057681 TaxID=3346209 RepID=UPI0036B488EF